LILEPSNPASALNAANVSAQPCGRFHADARLRRLYELPADRVPSYADSYHGLARFHSKAPRMQTSQRPAGRRSSASQDRPYEVLVPPTPRAPRQESRPWHLGAVSPGS
jgi:hypothetical protein